MKNIIIVFSLVFIFTMFFNNTAASQQNPLWDNESPFTIFLARYYQVDPIVVISLGQRMRDPDDVSVAIYLAKAADRDPMGMLEPRLKNKNWMEISRSLTIDLAILFTPLTSNEKIPEAFRHAYGEYAKHFKNQDYSMILYDKEFRNLVQLKLVTDAFSKSPISVMTAVSQGENYTDLILKELPPSEKSEEPEWDGR